MPNDTDARLESLEIKSSYAEDLMEQLNLTVFRQQQQIDRLMERLAELERRAPAADSGAPRSLRDELPPHY